MCELSRKLYYYFGRNDEHDYPASRLSNVILTGDSVYARNCFTESTLIRLIEETNPRDLLLYFYDCNGDSFANWLTSVPENKVFPHLEEIVCTGVNGDAERATMTTLEYFSNLIHSYKSGVVDVPKHRVLCIIKDFPQNPKFLRYVDFITEHSEEFGIYLFLSLGARNNHVSADFLNNFSIKICTPTSSNIISDMFLGNNCATKEVNEQNVAWVKVGNKVPVKYYVPFYPQTWIKKFIRVFSVYPNSM